MLVHKYEHRCQRWEDRCRSSSELARYGRHDGNGVAIIGDGELSIIRGPGPQR